MWPQNYEREGEETPELDFVPDLPSREYLKEKEVSILCCTDA